MGLGRICILINEPLHQAPSQDFLQQQQRTRGRASDPGLGSGLGHFLLNDQGVSEGAVGHGGQAELKMKPRQECAIVLRGWARVMLA